MAEAKEVRHAGIGVDLNMNGLGDLRKTNGMVDSLLESLKEADRVAEKFRNSFSGFGGKSSREMQQMRDAVKDTYHSMDSVKGSTSKAANSVHKLFQEVKYTSDAAKRIKINGSFDSEISNSTQKVKKLANEANQSGNKFTEMFRKLKADLLSLTVHLVSCMIRLKKHLMKSIRGLIFCEMLWQPASFLTQQLTLGIL